LKISFLLTAIFAALMTSAFAQSVPTLNRESRALLQGALADFDAKRFDEALAKLQEAEKTSPDDPFVINLIGAAYTKKKEYGTALSYFEKSLSKDPNFFPAQFNIAELDFLQTNYPAALERFNKMLERDPRNELLQFKIFLTLLQMNRNEEAAKVLAKIPYPGNTPAWYYAQAAWESKRGNVKKAMEYVSGARYIFGPKTLMFDETFRDLAIKLR